MRGWVHRFFSNSFGGFVLNILLSRFSFALPLKRLRETSSLIAIHHPDPAYPLHILLVPKKTYSSWTDVSPEDKDFLKDLARISQDLIQASISRRRGTGLS
ncbi:MAG: HIT domain-containing protein [Anaerolineales bacterium]|nr:HIT domain-containing protein [Anaerolineales bacterium]